jgi:hypothetical protein
MTRTKKYINLLTKLAIISGLPFGLLMGLKVGFQESILSGIVFGVCFSLMMGIIFIPIDYLLTKKLPPESISVHQSRDIRVKGFFEPVFESCINILKINKSIKMVTSLKDKNKIIARTGVSFTSFGENIILIFNNCENGIINIRISSSPIIKYGQIDFGNNFKNIQEISNAIINEIDKNINSSLT